MANHFGLWQYVAYNLTTMFAKCGKLMVESGANESGAVTIDFLTQSVDPHILAHRRESYIAVCANFLKRMASDYQNTLLRAQITLREDAEGQTHYDVLLETKDPPVYVKGTLVHVKGRKYAWEKRPVRTPGKKVPIARLRAARGTKAPNAGPESTGPHGDPHRPGALTPRAPVAGTGADSASPDRGYDGYEWLNFPPPAIDKKS